MDDTYPLRRPVMSYVQEKEKTKQRIGNGVGFLLIVLALSIDVTELVLEWLVIGFVINIVIVPPVALLFWTLFKLLKVKYMANTKKFAVAVLQPLIEFIPGLDATIIFSFMWTFGMLLIIGMTRMEDKGEEPTIIGALAELFKSAGPIMAPISFIIRHRGGKKAKQRMAQARNEKMREINKTNEESAQDVTDHKDSKRSPPPRTNLNKNAPPKRNFKPPTKKTS